MDGLVLTATVVGIITGVIAIGAFMFKMTQWVLSLRALLEKELTNNGGSSLKDKIERIEAKVDAVDVKHTETHALVMSHERELGYIQGVVNEIKENVK